ncbi:MAG: YfaZ family outer membrane protein [Thiohalospira sp.]
MTITECSGMVAQTGGTLKSEENPLMRGRILAALLLGAVLGAQAHAAGSLDLNINNTSAYGALSWPLGGEALLGTGEFYYNTSETNVGSLGLMVIGETGQTENPVEAGVGAKIMSVVNPEQDDFFGFAAAPGFGVRVYPPEANRLVVGANVNFAPEVVSFGDAKSLIETSFRLEYLLIPQAFYYIGYRRLLVSDIRTDESSVMDNGIHLGVRMLFD